MKHLLAVLAAALAAAAQTPEAIERELDSTARVASLMVDGDVCARIVTKRALDSILDATPRDKWMASDNYDVNHEPFIQTKKTLARLARLVSFPADVNLWMPIPGQPGRIHIVIRGVNELSQFWPWGALHQEIPAVMKKALASGQRMAAKEKPGFIAVLAPVTNSLGEVVGLVEVVARLKPNAHENVK
jgi:hypothetical protein